MVSKAMDICREYMMHAKLMMATSKEQMPAIVKMSMILFWTVSN